MSLFESCHVHPIKYRSVSFSDVYDGELDTLFPTLRHVKTTMCATNPDLIVCNPDTKPTPSSVLTYLIENNSYYYKQWKLDVITNRVIKADFFMTNPVFRKENPGIRWSTTTNKHTRVNTQDNKKIRIPSVTLTEEATFMGSLKKDQGLGLSPTIRSHYQVFCYNVSSSRDPVIRSPVTMSTVLLGFF